MNSIRQIQELNKRELENGVSPEASWHADYRDTAYIYIGGLPFELSEGDIITIFSQFGEPTYINLVRDKETGKSRGFAFLKYEDQRSTDLAVDNLGGAVIMGRTLRVDHTRYKKKDDEQEAGIDLTQKLSPTEEDDEDRRKRQHRSESESDQRRPLLKEERELETLIQEHDDEDPMKAYLIQEKKEEIALALATMNGSQKPEKSSKHRHHHRSHRGSKHSRKEDTTSSHPKRSRSMREGSESRRSRSRERFDDSIDRHEPRSEKDIRHIDNEKSRRRSPDEKRHDRYGFDNDNSRHRRRDEGERGSRYHSSR